MALPEKVWIVVCKSGFAPGAATPSDCVYEEISSSVLQADSLGMTKEQYDEVFGAIAGLICIILVFSLLKKAIEQ